MAKNETKQTRLFISYSRLDQKSIEELHQELNNDTNLEVFLDTKDILPSEEWRPRLEELIRSADTFLFALSANSIASEICQWELQFANSLNKRIIPVVLQDTNEDTPESIAKLNYIFLDQDHDFSKTIRTITAAIDIDIDWVREHTRIGDLSERWDKAQKINIQPLRGKELEAAEQWLATQPKNAPQPTPSQRHYIYDSRKSATKRQRTTIAASFIALLVVGALSMFALVQRNAAIEGERKAQAALFAGTRAANSLVFDLAGEFENSTIPSQIIESILDKARVLQEDLSKNFPNDLELLRSKLTALSALGDIYLNLKNTNEARVVYEQSLNISNQLIDAQPNNILWRQDVAIQTSRIALVNSIEGDVPGAILGYEKSLAIYRHLATLDPENARWQRGIVYNLDELSSIYSFDQRPLEQDDAAKESLEITRKLAAQFPSDPNSQNDLAASLKTYANVIIDESRPQARKLLEESLSITNILINIEPENTAFQFDFISTLNDIARMDLENGDVEMALVAFTKSQEMSGSLLASDSDNASLQNMHAITYHWIGEAKRQAQDWVGALTAYEEALKMGRALIVQDSSRLKWKRNVADSLVDIGDIKWTMNDLDGALSAYEEGLGKRREIAKIGPNSIEWQADVASLLRKIGTLKYAQQAVSDALSALKESLQITQANADIVPDQAHLHYQVWASLNAIGKIKAAQGDDQGAFDIYEKSLIVARRIIDLDAGYPIVQQDISFLLGQIGIYHYNRGDYAKASESFSALLSHANGLKTQFPNEESYANDAGYARIKTAEILARMALPEFYDKNFSEAESLLRRAIALDPVPLWMKSTLAFALMGQDKLEEADELFLKYRDQPTSIGQNWGEVVLNTISELRARGYTHPHMDQVLVMFEE